MNRKQKIAAIRGALTILSYLNETSDEPGIGKMFDRLYNKYLQRLSPREDNYRSKIEKKVSRYILKKAVEDYVKD